MVNINKLKSVIVENGMSQSDVAKKLGISNNSFYAWMQNPNRIGVEDAMRIAKILNIDDIFEFNKIFFSDWEW